MQEAQSQEVVRQRVYAAIQRAYNATVRPLLPRRPVTENGMTVRRAKRFDRYDGSDDYEAALIGGLRRFVTDGDHVCVVGGGWGVSACHAVDAGGRPVDVYEPGDDQVRYCRETIRENCDGDNAHVHHAAVGLADNVYGHTTAPVLAPSDLPDCDVLVLDCEGAEGEILDRLSHRPRAIVVEAHPAYGVPEARVRERLDDLGYAIDYRREDNHDDPIVVLAGGSDA